MNRGSDCVVQPPGVPLMWRPHHRGSGQGYREVGDGPLSPKCHLSKCHLFQTPGLALHYTQTTRGTGDPNTNSSLFAVAFVCWHLNGSLWFRFEASPRQNEIGRGWRGATPLFHSAAPKARPPTFPLYNVVPLLPWEFPPPSGSHSLLFHLSLSEKQISPKG